MKHLINQIIHGDSIEILSEIPSNSVDCILTDPPYGIDFQSNRRVASPKLPKIANDLKPFIEWIQDAYRITKETGRLILFCRWDVQEAFRAEIERVGYNVKSQIVWDKVHHGSGDLKGAFAPQHEIILYATKGRYIFPNKRPRSVISIPAIRGKKLIHPNQKPVELIKYILDHITLEKELVVDPFCGSGSTCVACSETNRAYIGIELDGKIYTKARERLSTLF
jgi:site-specific DNA-methyltransferase (adenine-specific)